MHPTTVKIITEIRRYDHPNLGDQYAIEYFLKSDIGMSPDLQHYCSLYQMLKWLKETPYEVRVLETDNAHT